MKETQLQDEIQKIKDNLEIEKLVSKKITDFIEKKRQIIETKTEKRDKLRETNINKLSEDKQDTQNK